MQGNAQFPYDLHDHSLLEGNPSALENVVSHLLLVPGAVIVVGGGVILAAAYLANEGVQQAKRTHYWINSIPYSRQEANIFSVYRRLDR